MKGIFRFYQHIAVIGRTTVSTQVSVGTRDPRQIEASQQIIPTVYHVGGGRRIGGGRNAGVCELCQIRALGGRTPSVTPKALILFWLKITNFVALWLGSLFSLLRG